MRSTVHIDAAMRRRNPGDGGMCAVNAGRKRK